MNASVNVQPEFSAELKRNPYASALREFIKGTINNPDFFSLSPAEQQGQAMSMIQKHKAI